jgi:hypothetical protein
VRPILPAESRPQRLANSDRHVLRQLRQPRKAEVRRFMATDAHRGEPGRRPASPPQERAAQERLATAGPACRQTRRCIQCARDNRLVCKRAPPRAEGDDSGADRRTTCRGASTA